MRRAACILVLSLAGLVAGGAWPDEAGIALSEKMLAGAERKYGADARKRLVAWEQLIAHAKGRPELEKLALVNDFFNGLPFLSDAVHWGREDYWATPAEMLASNGGDWRIFHRQVLYLAALGVPVDKLKITYVRARMLSPGNQAHMVLAYYATPAAIPAVLDNLMPEIRPASLRPDLTPYTFSTALVCGLPGSAATASRWQAVGQYRFLARTQGPYGQGIPVNAIQSKRSVMTLMRQLAAVIVVLFILLFVGTIVITVHDTRNYLNAQLRTISQDTATSLGLSLSPVMAANDPAVAESMVNAVFDSGYYRQVAIRGIDGKTILERQAQQRIEGVPGRVMRLLPLETPRGEALVDGRLAAGGDGRRIGHPGSRLT